MTEPEHEDTEPPREDPAARLRPVDSPFHPEDTADTLRPDRADGEAPETPERKVRSTTDRQRHDDEEPADRDGG